MSGITQSFSDYVAAHPKLRFTFFGGKGGVGKTMMAGVTALHLANQGKRTMLASTNPVHSLSGLAGSGCVRQGNSRQRRAQSLGL